MDSRRNPTRRKRPRGAGAEERWTRRMDEFASERTPVSVLLDPDNITWLRAESIRRTAAGSRNSTISAIVRGAIRAFRERDVNAE